MRQGNRYVSHALAASLVGFQLVLSQSMSGVLRFVRARGQLFHLYGYPGQILDLDAPILLFQNEFFDQTSTTTIKMSAAAVLQPPIRSSTPSHERRCSLVLHRNTNCATHFLCHLRNVDQYLSIYLFFSLASSSNNPQLNTRDLIRRQNQEFPLK